MIKNLELKNFKCFEKQTFSFSNLTLLTGLNGTGKSSVIQSFLSIRQSHERDVLDSIGLSLNGDYVNLGKGKDILFVDAQDETIAIKMETDQSISAQWTFDYQNETDVLKNSSGASNSTEYIYTSESLFSDRFQYLAAERIGPRVIYNVSDHQVRQHRRIGIHGEFAAHYLSLFGEEPVSNINIHHPHAQNNHLRSQVEAWLSEVTPGTRIHTTPHSGMDLVNLQYSFVHGNDATDQFRATNVGFGITYTLPVLVALLSAQPNDLLIIENPEAHLHPKGQRKLGELIALVADSGVQIITESHSDHLLNGIRLAIYQKSVSPEKIHVHYFTTNRSEKKKDTRVISPKIDSNGRIDNWPEGFFDEWDKSLEKLLTPKQ